MRYFPVVGEDAATRVRPPSRHRAAVWRELRETGALPLGQGARAVPDVPERVFAHLRAFSDGSDEGAR